MSTENTPQEDSTEGAKKTPQERLRAFLTRDLDKMQSRGALTIENPSGRAIASAFLDTWHWLDTPGMTWNELAGRVDKAYTAAVIAHRASAGTGSEDLWAYARADGFSGVRYWMRDLRGADLPGSVQPGRT